MRQWPDAPMIRYLAFANKEVLVCNSLNSYKDVLQTKCYSFKKPDSWRKVTGAITGQGVLVLEFEEVSLPGSDYLNGKMLIRCS